MLGTAWLDLRMLERGEEREKVGVLFWWEAGYVWWLFGGLGGGP